MEDTFTGWRHNRASGMLELVREGTVLAGCSMEREGQVRFVYQWSECSMAEAQEVVDLAPVVSVQPRF